MLEQLGLLLRAGRPAQWHKNLFVLAPLIFARRLGDPVEILQATVAFVVFSLLSSAVYIFNDLHDVEMDRHHPIKCKRPIASGRLPTSVAWSGLVVLLVVGLALAIGLARTLEAPAMTGWLVVTGGYLAINLGYNLGLKSVVIVDVLVVAVGFVLRGMGGAFAIGVDFSQWLLLCTFLVALFLALAKRRHELISLAGAASHRPILKEYSAELLEQMMTLAAAATLVAYTLYTRDPETVERTQCRHLIYTVPFVAYGLFRYLYLAHCRDEGGDPAELVLKDPGMIGCLAAWGLTVLGLLYWSG